jgi:hypothetical protein
MATEQEFAHDKETSADSSRRNPGEEFLVPLKLTPYAVNPQR